MIYVVVIEKLNIIRPDLFCVQLVRGRLRVDAKGDPGIVKQPAKAAGYCRLLRGWGDILLITLEECRPPWF